MSDSRPIGSVRAVMNSLQICRTTLYKLLREEPDFPAPFYIVGKLFFFIDEIEEFKASRPRRQYVSRNRRRFRRLAETAEIHGC